MPTPGFADSQRDLWQELDLLCRIGIGIAPIAQDLAALLRQLIGADAVAASSAGPANSGLNPADVSLINRDSASRSGDPAAIPTISGWGLMLLSMLLAGLAGCRSTSFTHLRRN